MNDNDYKVLMTDDDELIARSTAEYFNIPGLKTAYVTSCDAAWYNISDSIANCSVTVTRPEKSAVYVFNKFGEMIYTTHSKYAARNIPVPKGGKILFL